MLLIKWLVLPALVIGVVGVDKGTTGAGPQYRGVDSRLAAWAALGAAAVTSTATAAADPVATKQRIAITGKGDAHTFVLTPLTGGKLRRDSGTFSDCCWSERSIIRDGQAIEINNPLATYTGQRGTLIVRYRVEWANAGNGFTVGTGTWKIIRGTGVYKGITAGGRSAGAWSRDHFVSVRAEGLVRDR
jgi:hypothetical protein